jgi:DNA-binding transcriptional ArsR family regulator
VADGRSGLTRIPFRFKLEAMPPANRPHSPAFDGFTSPSYTQVPDELFDVLMPTLADAELRVLLYIIRRTFGFKRDTDAISLSQMVSGITTRDGRVLDHGTGLSKATVARGLKGLRDKGIILAERQRTQERGDQPTTYRLRFKTDIPELSPLSHGQAWPPVSRTRQALSQPRDRQHTASKETDIEYSKEEPLVDTTAMEQGREPEQSRSHSHQSGSFTEVGSLGAILQHRVRRDVTKDDRTAIAAVIERFADELGDRADHKLSVSRALNLYQAAGIGRDGFVDVLFEAKGEVKDRRQHPGKAPVPRNQMAYFFAVVADRLGLRTPAGDGD